MHARACAPASASSCAAVPVQHDPAVHAISTLFTFWQLCCVLILFGMFRACQLACSQLLSSHTAIEASQAALQSNSQPENLCAKLAIN